MYKYNPIWATITKQDIRYDAPRKIIEDNKFRSYEIIALHSEVSSYTGTPISRPFVTANAFYLSS